MTNVMRQIYFVMLGFMFGVSFDPLHAAASAELLEKGVAAELSEQAVKTGAKTATERLAEREAEAEALRKSMPHAPGGATEHPQLEPAKSEMKTVQAKPEPEPAQAGAKKPLSPGARRLGFTTQEEFERVAAAEKEQSALRRNLARAAEEQKALEQKAAQAAQKARDAAAEELKNAEQALRDAKRAEYATIAERKKALDPYNKRVAAAKKLVENVSEVETTRIASNLARNIWKKAAADLSIAEGELEQLEAKLAAKTERTAEDSKALTQAQKKVADAKISEKKANQDYFAASDKHEKAWVKANKALNIVMNIVGTAFLAAAFAPIGWLMYTQIKRDQELRAATQAGRYAASQQSANADASAGAAVSANVTGAAQAVQQAVSTDMTASIPAAADVKETPDITPAETASIETPMETPAEPESSVAAAEDRKSGDKMRRLNREERRKLKAEKRVLKTGTKAKAEKQRARTQVVTPGQKQPLQKTRE